MNNKQEFFQTSKTWEAKFSVCFTTPMPTHVRINCAAAHLYGDNLFMNIH